MFRYRSSEPGARAAFAAVSVIFAVGFALAAGGCSDIASQRDVRATILDEEGRPLPGAVLWAEARDEEGPFGWVIGVAGEAGEVPDSAREPRKIPWRPGARMVLAAFAPGRSPVIRGGGEERTLSDGAVFILEPLRPGAPATSLEPLSFPFEDAPDLAARARQDPAWSAMADAFRVALEARVVADGGISPGEMRKFEALGR